MCNRLNYSHFMRIWMVTNPDTSENKITAFIQNWVCVAPLGSLIPVELCDRSQVKKRAQLVSVYTRDAKDSDPACSTFARSASPGASPLHVIWSAKDSGSFMGPRRPDRRTQACAIGSIILISCGSGWSLIQTPLRIRSLPSFKTGCV